MRSTTIAPLVISVLLVGILLAHGTQAFHCSVQMTSDALGFIRGPAFFTNTTDSFTIKRSGLATTSPIVVTTASQVFSFMVMYFSPAGTEALGVSIDFQLFKALTAILDGYEFPLDLLSTSSNASDQWFPACCSPGPAPLPVDPKTAWMAATTVTSFQPGVDFRASNGYLSFLLNCNTA